MQTLARPTRQRELIELKLTLPATQPTEMHMEVSVAVNFVVTFLYGKLPRRRVHLFGEELDTAIKAKFLGHWYPEQPLKGTAYRSLKVSGDHPDPMMFDCARETGMEVSEIFQYLPDNLTLWIDPGEVSYRIGEKGAVAVLYTDKQQSQDLQFQTPTQDSGLASMSGGSSEFNPEAQDFIPIADQFLLAQNFATLGLSMGQPSPPIPQHNQQQQQQQQQQLSTWSNELSSYLLQKSSSAPNFFTAAAFAQTKFGSTKLRQQTRRPNRLHNGGAGGSSDTGGRPARQPRGISGGVNQHNIQQQHQYYHQQQHQQQQQPHQQQSTSNSSGYSSTGNFSSFNRSFSLSPGLSSSGGGVDWSTGLNNGASSNGNHLLSVHIPGGGGLDFHGKNHHHHHHSNGSSRQTSPGAAVVAAATAAVGRHTEQLLLAK